MSGNGPSPTGREFVFEEPPPPDYHEHHGVYNELKNYPGQWAKFGPFRKAGGIAYKLRQRGFEAVSRKEFLFVRWPVH